METEQKWRHLEKQFAVQEARERAKEQQVKELRQFREQRWWEANAKQQGADKFPNAPRFESASRTALGDPSNRDIGSSDDSDMEHVDVDTVRAAATETIRLHTEGNNLVKEKRWQDAVRKYEEALAASALEWNELKELTIRHSYCKIDGKMNPVFKAMAALHKNDPVLRDNKSGKGKKAALNANIAQCYLKLELYRRAFDAANACLKEEKGNHHPVGGPNGLRDIYQKGRFRRAQAAEKLGDFEMSRKDLEAVLAEDPGLAEAETALTRVRELELRLPRKDPVTSTVVGEGDEKQPPDSDDGIDDTTREKAVSGTSGGWSASRFGDPSGWAKDLSDVHRFEWLVDCYWLRLNEAYSNGHRTFGIFDENGTAGEVLLDFLLFCKLAVVRRVLPLEWDWPAFLKMARSPDLGASSPSACLLMETLPKRCEEAKWGQARGFSGSHFCDTGGRSLRFTGEVVYGTRVQDVDTEDPVVTKWRQDLKHEFGRRPVAEDLRGVVLRNVGGGRAWRRLRKCLWDPKDDHNQKSHGLREQDDPEEHECASCGKKNKAVLMNGRLVRPRFKKCSNCCVMRYCSEECQKADWKAHGQTISLELDAMAGRELGCAIKQIGGRTGVTVCEEKRHQREHVIAEATRLLGHRPGWGPERIKSLKYLDHPDLQVAMNKGVMGAMREFAMQGM